MTGGRSGHSSIRFHATPTSIRDSSGVRRFDLLEEAVGRAGPGKILFGTDGPWLHPAVELAKVHALRLTPAGKALVLGENWLRLTARARRECGRANGSRSALGRI